MKNIAKYMSLISFSAAFIFYIAFKGGIGEVDAPKDFLIRK